MKSYEKYDMDEVSHKYIVAELEQSTIITHMIWSFVGFFLFYFILLVSSTGFNLETIFTPIFAGILFSGMSYTFKNMEFLGGILLLPIRFILSVVVGMIYTPIKLIAALLTIKRYTPVIEEDKKRNPEIYATDIKDTVQLLIGDRTDISSKYVADEVIKYRSLFSKGQITRDEYVKMLRGIVDTQPN